MKFFFTLTLLASFLIVPGLTFINRAHAEGDYCDGHRDGHQAGSDTFGMGYPGYPGCPGDPGSTGGNASAYQRGFAAGMRQITITLCNLNKNHPNCR